MDYLTTAEMAKLWNVSQRWVAILCKQGKIEGAVLKGHTWFVPKETKKSRKITGLSPNKGIGGMKKYNNDIMRNCL